MFLSSKIVTYISLAAMLGLVAPSVSWADSPAAPPVAVRNIDHSLDAKLVAAVVAKDEKEVRKLLKRGADPNSKGQDSYATPVLASASGQYENLEIVKALIENGANLELTSSQGATALALACLDTHIPTVKYLLQAGAKVDARITDGLTPLMLAASAGELETVRLLMAAGADVNAQSKTKGTPLIYGCAKTIAGTGNLEIIKMLVDAGADVAVVATNGKNAVLTAQGYGLNDIANYLIEIDKRDNDLFNAVAAAFNDRKNPNSTAWKAVQDMLTAGANPRYTTSDGRTELMFLTYGIPGCDDAALKSFIARSDLSSQEAQFGATALQLAVDQRQPALVSLLIKAGTPLELTNKKGETALDMAYNTKNEEIINLLKAANAPGKPQPEADEDDPYADFFF